MYFFVIDEREREREREERETLICFSTYLCINWLILLCTLIGGLNLPATLAYVDDALTKSSVPRTSHILPSLRLPSPSTCAGGFLYLAIRLAVSQLLSLSLNDSPSEKPNLVSVNKPT